MATTLAVATLFPIPPDGGEPERLSRAWLTVIGGTESGKETRASLRAIPVRRYEYTAAFGSAAEAMRFRGLWHTAPQRMRFLVPVWQRSATIAAFATAHNLAGDFTYRLVGESRALVWQSETEWELVDIIARDDATIELADDLGGTYVAGAAQIIPVMTAWLEPPTIDLLGANVERVPLAFTEEVPGVSGADPSVGLSAVPAIVSVAIKKIAHGTDWTGRKFETLEADALDAAGIVVPGVPVTWTVTDLGAGATNVRITEHYDGRQLQIAFDGGTSTYFSITATAGGVTSPAVS